MSIAHAPQPDDEFQPIADTVWVEHDNNDRLTEPQHLSMADLLAKVPNMALLAAAFFVTLPQFSPDVMRPGH